MPTRDFVIQLVDALTDRAVPSAVASALKKSGGSRKPEELFECDFVVPLAAELAAQHEDVWLFTHKCGATEKCRPNCHKTDLAPSARIRGCSRCWSDSKRWGTVSAFGTKHTFDMVGKDSTGCKFAIEIKVVNARGGRMPNGSIQALLGQTALAAAKFDYVIGVCGYLHTSTNSEDSSKVAQWFQRGTTHNVRLVFKALG